MLTEEDMKENLNRANIMVKVIKIINTMRG